MDIEKYRDLFVHRGDVFAQQQESGAYFPVKRPLENWDLVEHLAGVASYGTYVIDPEPIDESGWPVGENTVKYVVFDLDTYDEGALEFLCREVENLLPFTADVAHEKFPCLLLENSGGKGYHIWLFLSEPLPAAQVRAWAEIVRTHYDENRLPSSGGDPDQVWPELEIFPKQDVVQEGGFGNLVKLPLGVHAKTGVRSEIIPRQGWANGVSKGCKLDSSLVPPLPAGGVALPSQRPVQAGGGREAPFACITKLINEGAPEGCRDRAMFHLAHYAWGTGFPPDLIAEFCERANEKFDPPLTSEEVATKIRSARGMAAAHPSCNADWLRGFCPGGGTCYAPWNDARPSRSASTDDDYRVLTREERRRILDTA